MKLKATIEACGFGGFLTLEGDFENEDSMWDVLSEQIGHLKENDCEIKIENLSEGDHGKELDK